MVSFFQNFSSRLWPLLRNALLHRSPAQQTAASRELQSPSVEYVGSEKGLHENETILRSLFDYSPDAIIVVDNQGRLVRVNRQAETMFGYSQAELEGQPLEILVPARFHDRHVAYRSTYLNQPGFRPMGAGLNLYGLRRDGQEFPIEVSLSPIETEDGPLVMSAIRDITARKRAEEDLLQSERFNERITSTLPYIIYVFDIVERRNIYSNQQMLHFLGYTPQEIQALGSDFLPKLLHPDDLIHLQELLQRWDTATDSDIIETEYRMKHADGSWHWFLGSDTVFMRTPEGRVKQIIGAAQDISERKQMEQALQDSEQRFRTLVEGSIQGILVQRNTKPIFLNEAYAHLLGYESPDEILSMASTVPLIAPYDQERLLDYHAAHLRGEPVPSTYECDLVCRDGSIITVQDMITLITWDGSPATLSTVIDITERKRSEEALQASERYYRLLAESLTDYVIYLDGESRIQYINRLAEGYTMDMVQGRHMLDFISPESHQATLHALRTVLETGQPVSFENFGQRTSTMQGWYFTRLVPIRDGADITGVFLIATDITERKRADQKLRDNEKLLRTIAENFPRSYLSVINRDMTIGFTNGQEFKHRQLNPDLFIGLHIRDIFGPYGDEILEVVTTAYEKTFAGQEQFFELFIDGEYQSYAVVPLMDEQGEIPQILAVVQNITERQQMVEKIQRSNRELNLLNQVIAASVANLEQEAILDIACRELAVTFQIPDVTVALFNETKTTVEVVAEYCTDGKPSAKHLVVPVEGNPATQYLLRNQTPLVIDNAQDDSRLASFHELMRQRSVVSLMILPLTIKKEVVGTVNLTTTEPRPFSTEEVNLAWSVAEELGGALARTRLGQARRLLSAAVEQSAESILITDTSGAIIYVNPTFEKVSGYSGAEVLGQTPRILKSDRHEVAIYQDLWTTIRAGRVWHDRLTNQKKDGSWYTVDAIIAPVRDEEGTIVNYLALQRDITNELQLEEQLRQSQKMEAVGRLVGGMAHDFNNLLTVINGHADLLLESYESPDDPRREDAEHIRKAGKRAVTLTRQLLAFSRRQPLELQLLNLSRVVANLEDMLRRLIGEHITLTTFLTSELDYVRADPGQIEQVILNLVVNARDAMPQGGRLNIVTANIDLDKSVAEIYRVTPGPQVGLMIIDTGVGIESETQRHIFEPFFTTKELGKGTGLGLAIVYGIVKQSGGHIQVDSTPGRGTIFRIYLPRAEKAVLRAASPAESPPSLEGRETILLVEDEASVRLIARKFLKSRGYKVLEAGHAEEAQQLCRQHADQIDLLITDVIMPGMSGPQLAENLTLSCPHLKVLYISGYTDEILGQHQAQIVGLSFLEKPFTSDALALKVREALDRAD